MTDHRLALRCGCEVCVNWRAAEGYKRPLPARHSEEHDYRYGDTLGKSMDGRAEFGLRCFGCNGTFHLLYRVGSQWRCAACRAKGET